MKSALRGLFLLGVVFVLLLNISCKKEDKGVEVGNPSTSTSTLLTLMKGKVVNLIAVDGSPLYRLEVKEDGKLVRVDRLNATGEVVETKETTQEESLDKKVRFTSKIVEVDEAARTFCTEVTYEDNTVVRICITLDEEGNVSQVTLYVNGNLVVIVVLVTPSEDETVTPPASLACNETRFIGPDDSGADFFPSISPDGRHVLFGSNESHVTSGGTGGPDTNESWDVFLHDLSTSQTSRVSVGPGGTQFQEGSFQQSMSGDSRYILFRKNPFDDVLNILRDRMNDRNEILPIQADTTIISEDGFSIIFTLPPDQTRSNINDLFVYDRRSASQTRLTQGLHGEEMNGGVSSSAISADGHRIVFGSNAPNLVENDQNGKSDIFVRDRLTNQTRRVNIGPGGVEANEDGLWGDISSDGNIILFQSMATNLDGVCHQRRQNLFMHDLRNGRTSCVTRDAAGTPLCTGDLWTVSISANNRHLVFSCQGQVYVKDLISGTVALASRAPDGSPGNAESLGGEKSITSDGRCLLYRSHATNLVPGAAGTPPVENFFGMFVVPNPLFTE